MSREHTIVTGDALEAMGSLSEGSVDLIIADPPYNLGKEYGNNRDLMGFEEYIEFSRHWLRHAHRVLSNKGTMYVFMGFRFISHLYDILERELHMEFCNWICWHYTQGIGRKRGFSPRHDDILMFTASNQYTFNLDDVRVPQKYYRKRNNMRGANPGDVWEFSHVHYCNENRQAHPTQKPEGLMERMVLASSNPGDLVLDPFCGSGTSLRVCQQLNRSAIGIELNPEYVEIVRERLKKPFSGFDSMDPRMARIPLDLRDADIRKEYLSQHQEWFLGNHQDAASEFRKAIEELYGTRATPRRCSGGRKNAPLWEGT